MSRKYSRNRLSRCKLDVGKLVYKMVKFDLGDHGASFLENTSDTYSWCQLGHDRVFCLNKPLVLKTSTHAPFPVRLSLQ